MADHGINEDIDTSPHGIDAIRQRLYRISDTTRIHDRKIDEHSVVIGIYGEQIKTLQQSACTKEQMENGLAKNIALLEAYHRENVLKLDNLDARFSPLMKAIYWVAALVIGGFFAQLINIISHSPK
jgi:hypothetical protein